MFDREADFLRKTLEIPINFVEQALNEPISLLIMKFALTAFQETWNL